MANQPVYLRPNVVAEPLFNDWYAWAYLVSPVTAAMYVANFHLKIMQSFVSAPQLHVNALKNPEMIGGPYINYPPERVNDVRALMQKSISEQTRLFELAKAVAALENSEPLLSIMRINIKALPEDPQFQQILLNASTAMVKR